MKGALAAVRKQYNVPAYRGVRVQWSGCDGRILSATESAHVVVLFDSGNVKGKRLRCHPTELKYTVTTP